MHDVFQTTDFWAERIHEEWKTLEENLPEGIFVRVYESRIDLLRAVIVGAKGTPYQDGLFFFDVFFPRYFPIHPPIVRYRSGGFSINPLMFECGEVRLTRKLWPSHVATMLEFLVSIRDQVLNADPLSHEPGFLDHGPSEVADYFSLLYNEDIRIKSLKSMIKILNKPPKVNFEAFVVGHFRNHMADILMSCQAYMKGLQVGGNTEGCCSMAFRDKVEICMFKLIFRFIEIGATEAYAFIPPRESTHVSHAPAYKHHLCYKE
ncbi:putative ubiquitin-conjugating enzyme E2, ubiquitin-conjugating enzyme/RWD [Helianthus anomalus]